MPSLPWVVGWCRSGTRYPLAGRSEPVRAGVVVHGRVAPTAAVAVSVVCAEASIAKNRKPGQPKRIDGGQAPAAQLAAAGPARRVAGTG